MPQGYSDSINHALAFAAKHHDQQVRRGTRLPYATQPANVAIILTRYGQDDDTVIGGILHNVVADYITAGFTRERLAERIGEKFGENVLELLLEVAEQRYDEDGVEMSPDERRADFISRLKTASNAARWVCSAEKLHAAASLMADLRRTEFPETVWDRQANGRENTIRWYRTVHQRLKDFGFSAEIMLELGKTIEELERFPA